MAESPWSDDPDAPQVPYWVYYDEKIIFAGTLIGAIFYGIAVVLFFRCMGALFDRTRRNAKWVLVAHTTAIFSIVTVYTAINLDMQSISCIDSRGFPGVNGELPPGPVGYQYFIYAKAINVVATVMFLLNGWLADGLLLYRCYVIYSMSCWVIALPCLMYLASLAIGIVLVYQGSRPGDLIKVNAVQHEFGLTYYSISFALNVILTLMIVGRLLLLNRRIRKAMNAPVKVSGLYKTIVTTLVESYALYSVALLLFIGSFSAGDPIAGVFFPTLVEVEAIAPFLITIRVANQSASNNVSIVSGYTSSIHFGSRGKSMSSNEDPVNSMDPHGGVRVELDIGVETTIDLHHGD